jgi:uncharacterized protein GlcG (DUF336 family)
MIHTISNIDLKTAIGLVSTAINHATSNGWLVAVSVVDAGGSTVASARMDGATAQILTFAEDKAFTASTMKRTTAAYFDRMDKSGSLRLGLANRERLLVWGGGLPIKFEGAVVGGIGVSGAQDYEDVACAQEALKVAGLSWE